jgi:glutamate racemase
MVTVFDSGAGGAHVASVLRNNGIDVKLASFPEFFPFGNKPHDSLAALFRDFRLKTEGTIFCACNTMSLVLRARVYDFFSSDVIPTFPDFSAGAPVCYGTENTVRLASSMFPEFKGVAVPELVQVAEDLYCGRVTRAYALEVFSTFVKDRVQLGSTHLSYLAHELGLADAHVEPDYSGMFVNHVALLDPATYVGVK